MHLPCAVSISATIEGTSALPISTIRELVNGNLLQSAIPKLSSRGSCTVYWYPANAGFRFDNHLVLTSSSTSMSGLKRLMAPTTSWGCPFLVLTLASIIRICCPTDGCNDGFPKYCGSITPRLIAANMPKKRTDLTFFMVRNNSDMIVSPRKY